MTKIEALRVTNIFLLISAVIQAFTAVALFFDLFASRAKLLGIITWTHAYNGLLLIGLVAIHVFLNWGWVKAQFFKKG